MLNTKSYLRKLTMLGSYVFPFRLYLNVLQLEEYKLVRFMKWILKNFWVRSLEGKKKLVWTQKVKYLCGYSLVYLMVGLLILVRLLGLWGLVFILLIFVQPYILLLVAVLTHKPYELVNRFLTKRAIRNKILKMKTLGMRVIGITGSYGKTSTKEFLYHILKSKYKVLKTPESYNTLFGLAKVVDYELYEGYDYFIVEMGAYCKGEIKELCDVTVPDYAILTGINEQHLERFGKIENTIEAKFELVQSVSDGANCVLNADNTNIVNNYLRFVQNPMFYGLNPLSQYVTSTLKDIKLSGVGSSFIVEISGKSCFATTPLVGTSNLSNMLGACTLASHLGMSLNDIVCSLATLESVLHRLQIKQLDWCTLIDDAYSSNVTGFKEALKLLNSFENCTRVLVTPGVVELGSVTSRVHKELGDLAAKSCDLVYLVGKNERTLALEEGIGGAIPIIYLNTINDLFSHVQSSNLHNPIILLENDLPDNY